MKSKVFKRRWRGFTERQVSERMRMISQKRFKTPEDKAAHIKRMVEARGSWQLVNGKKVYVKKS